MITQTKERGPQLGARGALLLAVAVFLAAGCVSSTDRDNPIVARDPPPTATPTPTGNPTPTPEPTATPSPTPTSAPVETDTPTPDHPTATPEPSPTGAVTPEPSATPAPTPTAFSTPTPTPGPSPTPIVIGTAPKQVGLYLELEGVNEQNVVRSDVMVVRGRTSPDAVLSINGVLIPLEDDGSFEVTLTLDEGPNRLEVVSSDLSGNVDRRELWVVALPETPTPEPDEPTVESDTGDAASPTPESDVS